MNLKKKSQITDEGRVYSTGANSFLQCGIEGIKTLLTPTQIPSLPKVVQIACGWNHSLFLTANNVVYSCGRGKYGQLGLGIMIDTGSPPKPIPLDERIVQIACGSEHSLLLSDKG